MDITNSIPDTTDLYHINLQASYAQLIKILVARFQIKKDEWDKDRIVSCPFLNLNFFQLCQIVLDFARFSGKNWYSYFHWNQFTCKEAYHRLSLWLGNNLPSTYSKSPKEKELEEFQSVEWLQISSQESFSQFHKELEPRASGTWPLTYAISGNMMAYWSK
ncbi:hypothetical protein L218DRAFT_946264 [Marasmius fiardii PR-910]|nr:hypothetical protein L218DRAFT_946264 [Marasmius fiardii PR-910]